MSSIILNNCILISIQITLFIIGSTKITQLVFNDNNRNKSVNYLIRSSSLSTLLPRLLFSLTFSCSCTLFLLIFSEIIQLFSKNIRYYYWKVNMTVLLFLVIIIIPWFQLYTFLYMTRGWKLKPSIYLSTCLLSIYLYFFYKLGGGNDNKQKYVSIISWIESSSIIQTCCIGITLISILSGFGVVNKPWTILLAYKRHVSEHDYKIAEHVYHQTEKIIQERRELLNQLIINQPSEDNSSSSTFFIHRIMSSLSSDTTSEKKEIRLLQTEIEQLEELTRNMKSDLNELEHSRVKIQFNSTWKGQIWGFIEKVFAIYCIYRLLIVSILIKTSK
ncbi:uncharacterized protein BX663DRAFT_527719 [Cokeromyces recurvatus]|uniref:uncharacterized protein n=1 Tax=Cokeromyces recurvatus TaxID=90255 RepID=UPI00221F5EF3|nr:uncharacterized protein BX663DRAFT_527719 [Cokeromyces recurvatus]KAI7897624.1 hypothetical protein BX663DRAFT_527719 [Cokeromyces recurvatus]